MGNYISQTVASKLTKNHENRQRFSQFETKVVEQ